MSNSVFPTLAGTTIDVQRTPQYQTSMFETVGGGRQTISWRATPRYTYHLKIEVARDNVDTNGNSVALASSEVGVLLAFLDVHLGSYDSFLFTDPYDGVQRRVRLIDDKMTITKFAKNLWELNVTLETD